MVSYPSVSGRSARKSTDDRMKEYFSGEGGRLRRSSGFMSRVRAPEGHAATQSPQPMQRSWSIATVSSDRLSAFMGQRATQAPHDRHFPSSYRGR